MLLVHIFCWANTLYECHHVLFSLYILLSLCYCQYGALFYITGFWFVNQPRVAEWTIPIFFFTSKYQLRKRCFFCTSLFSNPSDWAMLSQRPEWDFVIVGKKYKQYILHCYHWSNVKVLLERGHSHAHNCFCSQLYSKSLL